MVTRRLFVCSLGAGACAYAKSWERPLFPDWKPEFVDKVLTDSPWAKSYTAAFELRPDAGRFTSTYAQIGFPGAGLPLPLPGQRPGGSRPAGGSQSGGNSGGWATRTEIYLTIRFASALPVRQALALTEFGREGLESDRAKRILAPSESEYVIEVGGFPATAVKGGAKLLQEDFAKSARLVVRGHAQGVVASADVPEWGNHLVATLRFPRFADLGPEDGKLKLVASVGPIRIDQAFALNEMVYRGRLEL